MKTLEDVLVEIAPEPDPDFVAAMEERMKLGFPPPAGKRRLPRVALPELRPRALAGVAAGAMLALLVTVSVVGGGDSGSEPQPAPDSIVMVEEKPAALPQRDSDDSAAAGTALPPPEPLPTPDLAPGRGNRRVERSAQMTLAAETEEFDTVADSIFGVTARHDGFVLRSSFTQSEDGGSTGFFELRIPSARLEQALGDLSGVATVRSRSESGNDVTGAFVSLRDRLTTSLAERKGLLRRLEVAPTETAATAIRRRLAAVNRKIGSRRAELRAVRERTEFAAVAVELVDKETAPASQSETDEALDDAVGSLESIFNFLIRALGILVPVTVTGLAVWFAATRARRRARERALA